MKIRRLITGLIILLGSGSSSYIVANAIGSDVIGFVAVSSIIGFIGGCFFASGVRR